MKCHIALSIAGPELDFPVALLVSAYGSRAEAFAIKTPAGEKRRNQQGPPSLITG